MPSIQPLEILPNPPVRRDVDRIAVFGFADYASLQLTVFNPSEYCVARNSERFCRLTDFDDLADNIRHNPIRRRLGVGEYHVLGSAPSGSPVSGLMGFNFNNEV